MATHPIIALWAHPRSMSTAMERVMRERGDLICFHEPFLYDYYVHRRVREFPHFSPEPGKPTSYVETRKMLLTAAETGPVFLKDHAYYVVPQMLEDRAFLNRITHAFLIRDPRRSLASYQKLDPAFTLEEAGLEAMWRLFEITGGPVVAAEDVQDDPQAFISALWRALSLPDAPHAFSWSGAPSEWGDVQGWHASVSASSGIKAVETDAGEVFHAAAATAPRLEGMLSHHLPFYERLRSNAISR